MERDPLSFSNMVLKMLPFNGLSIRQIRHLLLNLLIRDSTCGWAIIEEILIHKDM